MFRKGGLMETLNEEPTIQSEVEQTGRRSFENLLANLPSGLVAYSFF